jgi:hypothetical protein
MENYTKRSFRNRAYIATANGILRLSIPLAKGKNERQAIREVQISYEEPWQQKHWTAICSAYGNAPFFEYYKDDLQPLFETKEASLFEYNKKILQTLFYVLDMHVDIQYSKAFLPIDKENAYDFRNKINPKANAYALDAQFKVVPYQQVFQEKTGFIPNLSILDLIFCKGPETMTILEASINEIVK